MALEFCYPTDTSVISEPGLSDRLSASACLVCAGHSVETFLNLGRTPFANGFLTEKQLSAQEQTHPLEVGFCHDCSHVQLTTRVSPRLLFEEYLYLSSSSDTLKTHLTGLSALLTERYRLG